MALSGASGLLGSDLNIQGSAALGMPLFAAEKLISVRGQKLSRFARIELNRRPGSCQCLSIVTSARSSSFVRDSCDLSVIARRSNVTPIFSFDLELGNLHYFMVVFLFRSSQVGTKLPWKRRVLAFEPCEEA